MAVYALGLLVLLMAGSLLFVGCEQPNDPVPQAETEESPKTAKPNQDEDGNGDRAEPDQPDTPDEPDTPVQPNTSEEPEEPHVSEEPATPAQPNTSEEPDIPVPPPEEPPALAELTGAAAVKAYLAGLPENTHDTPYRIAVKGIDLSKKTEKGDTLRTLYEAFSRYVSLDLRGCTGEKLLNVTTDIVPSKAYLVSLTLPDSVTLVEVNAFSGCTALSSVNMPKVHKIIHGAFSNLPRLTAVYMPEIQSIETSKNTSGGVFYKCTALTSVAMPKLVSLGDYAFYGCTELQSITLGSTPPALEGTNIFKNVKLLSAIYVPAAAVESYKKTSEANWTSDLKEKVQALL
ncbi:MAG: leucine-rich repeat protein [Treponema sp.]|nr:leucine-rich repeat protein [Treponema sp.]